MPGLQSDCSMPAAVSPVKKSRLSLKFFQKNVTKRALDFSETVAEDPKTAEPEGPAVLKNYCDQVVPVTHHSPPLTCERGETLVPFVGLNNLGNTCYLNSILQVLYYCPGFKDGIKKLFNVLTKTKEKLKNEAVKNELEDAEPDLPVNLELLGSFHSLMVSLEQLQSSFLLNPQKHGDGDLATPPRRLLSILRQLNPMYEGYLQHDAQEVLQCILGYIQEACETMKDGQKSADSAEQPPDQPQVSASQPRDPQAEGAKGPETTASEAAGGSAESLPQDPEQEENPDGPLNGKRKSDTEAGNAKKKSKTLKGKKGDGYYTRSKRKSSSDIISVESPEEDAKEEEEEKGNPEGKGNGAAEGLNKKRRSRLSWLKPSGKQPSIFSKFCSMGRISTHAAGRGGASHKGQDEAPPSCGTEEPPTQPPHQTTEEKGKAEEDEAGFDLMERMFQGQLVLRTRCLECERYTERREDFQNISVPVQEDEPRSPDSEISPDPKLEPKTLQWAISQFASVERIVGQDKYFCETCHHYTEAERSLLFDKTPEVVTIHLKCFAASNSEIDPYAGLSKVNTPLQTPLTLSLEEWGTRPSKEHYELFAVVMHSGVTISSGHYTAFVKMLDLKEPQQLQAEDAKEEEEARTHGPQEYDDGEVSFGPGPKPQAPAGKAGSKKGLLGGQRSVSSGFEMGTSKQANPDKAATTDGNKSECPGAAGDQGAAKKSGNLGGEEASSGATASNPAPGSLLDYEGKWMLFDDCDVRLFDERDFLNACSPETCTTSTPYLLFYKKVCQE